MPYSNFTLSKVKTDFDLTTNEKTDLFADSPLIDPSPWLKETLTHNIPLALATSSEKARSEMIVAPILIEVKKLYDDISLFSGVEFTVDSERELSGICGFLLSCSPEQLEITAPVLMIVEAKKENIVRGIGQCAAEMVAARIFNQAQGIQLDAIYGIVTSGNIWRFLKLVDQTIYIDVVEYYIKDVDKVLGILVEILNNVVV